MPLEQEQARLSPEINLTITEAVDLLWLMVQIGQPISISEVTEPTIDPLRSSVNVKPITTDRQLNLPPVENTAPVHPQPRRSPEPESGSALPIAITDPLALRNALALERSLRPLMRKQPSLTEIALDEEATVTSIAEAEQGGENFWVPVLKPVQTRWLDIAFVIEKTERYHLWQPILTEFQQLLERHGAFRKVSLWYLQAGSRGEVQIYAKDRRVSYKELLDPSGRRLIWVASDCVSTIWHNGSLMKILRDWGRVQPVALLQFLPEQLWSRTALGWGVEVQLPSETPGTPSSQLLKNIPTSEIQVDPRKALTLPVVTLESLSLKNWAQVLAGVAGSKTPGLVFLPEEVTPQSSDRPNQKLSAKARVSRFRAAASPLSRELAAMMAAAPVSLPVIRLIQQTLLPRSNAVHVTEVLTGGLLKPIKAKKNGITKDISYEFYQGVRQELIKITPISKTIGVIERISEFVNEELRLRGSIKSFDAMLFSPEVELDPDYLPFARITAATLQLLGGRFAEIAQQIYQKIEHPPTKETGDADDGLEPEFLEFEFDVASVQILRLEMIPIPAGSFMMGVPKNEKDGYDDERPQHRVRVPAFLMGKYQVTQAQWRIVAALPQIERELEPDPSNFKGDNLPVERVSWLEAVEFCARLSEHTGREYRLPSEAEWEYACRAGTTTAYSFGNGVAELENYAWYDKNSESKTHPVGEKPPNAFGLHDMHGNVLEWCEDDWHGSYKGAPTDGRAWLDNNDNRSQEEEGSKLLRGGSWIAYAWSCRSAFRFILLAGDRDYSIGFRVVCRLQ